MQVRLSTALTFLVGTLVFLSLTGFSKEPSPIPDGQLVSAIQQRLKMDGRIDAERITVQAKNGHITLEGMVETLEEKGLAEGLVANTIIGVRSVVNNLSVRPTVIEDDAIQREVKKNIMTTAALNGTSINPTVRDGIVKLKGTVNTPVQRRVARKVAELVDGTLGVVDVLTVAQTSRPDSEIEKEVALYLLWSPHVDIDKIDIEVKKGVVSLKGSASQMTHILTVEKDLEKVTGVVEVDVSGLQVQA